MVGMIETIGAYIKTITALTIFSAFVGILMPDGRFRTYVDMILGILVLTAVLTPFLRVFGIVPDEFTFRRLTSEIEENATAFSKTEYEAMEQNNLNHAYGIVLEERIQEDLTANFQGIEDVTLSYCGDVQSEDYGKLEEIEISVTTNEATEEEEAVIAFVAKRYEIDEASVSIVN